MLNRPSVPRASTPVYTSPAIICDRCGRTLSHSEYEPYYLESKRHCTCGGRFRFVSISERYAMVNVYWCPTLKRYYLTADCPRPECWAKSCHIAEAMAEKIAMEVA